MDAVGQWLLGDANVKRRDIQSHAQETIEAWEEQTSLDHALALRHAQWPPLTLNPPSTSTPLMAKADVAFQDIGMFAGYGYSTGSKSVFEAIDRTSTRGGSGVLRELVRHPIYDLERLRARQAALAHIRISGGRGREVVPDAELERSLATMRETEPSVLWLFHCFEDPVLMSWIDMAFFRSWPLRMLNHSDLALTAYNVHRVSISPWVGLVSPLLTFIIPYLILRVRVRLRISPLQYLRMALSSARAASKLAFSAMSSSSSSVATTTLQWLYHVSYALSIVFYFQNVLGAFETSALIRDVCSLLHQQLNGVRRFLAASDRVRGVISAAAVDDDDAAAVLAYGHRQATLANVAIPAWFHDAAISHKDAQSIEDTSQSLAASIGGVQDTSAALIRWGVCGGVLRSFNRFKDRLDDLRRVMRYGYGIDALVAIRKLLLPAVPGSRPGSPKTALWSNATFLDGPKVKLELNGLRHPQHAGAGAESNGVPNSWSLDDVNPGAIVTGPNAGGKSTLLKATLASVLLAQSLTVAPCSESITLVPFSAVCSQINVPDSHGVASLFEAEMRRSKAAMDTVAERHAQGLGPTLVVMDELFSSTNPVEGIAGAWAVAQSLVDNPGAAAVILSTHFTYLCRLERATKALYRNYQLPVRGTELLADSSMKEVAKGFAALRYPYKLERGICRQCIAIELLARNGFSPKFVERALLVKRALVAAPVQMKSKSISKAKE